MFARVLEPEVMDTAAEARDYDAMDHSAVNTRFCDDFLVFANELEPRGQPALGRRTPRVVDFGTGTALIPIELCKRAAGFVVVAIDLAQHMLDLARENVARAGLAERVLLERVDAKGTPYEDGAFGATISNSIIHHIPEPARCLAEMWRVTAQGGLLFVRDLHRPDGDAEVDRLVALYAGDPRGEPPADPARVASYENQRALFRASLCAALTVAEVTAMVAPFGVPASAVRMTSDRHWTLAFEKPLEKPLEKP
jgi:ubiquinone/menaquinone biosynthesis C-methylase UbiE